MLVVSCRRSAVCHSEEETVSVEVRVFLLLPRGETAPPKSRLWTEIYYIRSDKNYHREWMGKVKGVKPHYFRPGRGRSPVRNRAETMMSFWVDPRVWSILLVLCSGRGHLYRGSWGHSRAARHITNCWSHVNYSCRTIYITCTIQFLVMAAELNPFPFLEVSPLSPSRKWTDVHEFQSLLGARLQAFLDSWGTVSSWIS